MKRAAKKTERRNAAVAESEERSKTVATIFLLSQR